MKDAVDPVGPRTSQRAELLAAIEGLKQLETSNRLRKGDSLHKPPRRDTDTLGPTYIVVADSEYVVKGITEWFPTWRVKNWRTAAGK